MHRRPLLLLACFGLLAAACGASAGGSSGGGGGGGAENVVVGDADEGIDGVQAVRVPDHSHTMDTVDYGLKPPAGGTHNPVWVNCGFYDQSFADENVVHDLEHGAVWLAYSPTLSTPEVDKIHDLARQNAKVIATPYDDLKPGVAVVATAWARQLTLDSVDDARLAEFVAQYQDGKQAPEAGVTCSSSTLGEPIP